MPEMAQGRLPSITLTLTAGEAGQPDCNMDRNHPFVEVGHPED
jgi:hypothetical protein